jgi:H+/Cl- antiporter ClcA
MSIRFVVLAVGISLGVAQSVPAQSRTQSQRRSGATARSTAVWTSVGTAAGFGAGLYLGLVAFDDARNSDRKVWTSAAVGAGVGALAGYLVARIRRDDRRHAAPVTDPERAIHLRRLDPTPMHATPVFKLSNPPFHSHGRIESATAPVMPVSPSNK